jgi:SAM-dependent methyltransferase
VTSQAIQRPTGIRRIRTLWRLFRNEREDPAPFYTLLAAEAAEMLDGRYGIQGKTIVDLGCGPGFYTAALRARGAIVIPVDADLREMEMVGAAPEGAILADAGALPLTDESVDGAFFSNALEHIDRPERVIDEIERVLKPGGWAYISWTNWYSPWGGHDMSPYHYLGPAYGPRLYHRRHGPPRKNTYGEGLFATYVGKTMRYVDRRPHLATERVEPRYWPKLAFICRIPVVREFLTWNCVIYARKTP